MRFTYAGIIMAISMFTLAGGSARSGEANVDVNDLKYGMRYCPAPWCDNKEFIETHFGIDATTGKVSKYVGNNPPVEVGSVSGVEEVLYVSPPGSKNGYVQSGAVAASQPRRGLTGVRQSAAAPAPRYSPAPASANRQPPPVQRPVSPSSYNRQSPPQQQRQVYAQPAARQGRPAVASVNSRQAAANLAAAGPASGRPDMQQPAGRPMTRNQQQPAKLPWWKAMWR